MGTIQFTAEPPKLPKAMADLYEALHWDSLGLSEESLMKMCNQSWYVLYVYDENWLIGTGRILSDEVVTAIICGVGVHPDYQRRGIGEQLTSRLIRKCETNGIVPQLMCIEELKPYYTALGFEKFAVGMAWKPA